MNQITPEYIKGCLQSVNDYKNSKSIKQATADDNIELFKPVCIIISQTLLDHLATPMNKLLALRLSKDLVDVFNLHFIETFGAYTLKSFKMYAEFKKPSEDPNRGSTLFSQQPNKDEKQMGLSIVRLALDCIRAWAMFFPQTPSGQQSVYFEFYQELLREGVHFPTWAYYKEDFISQHKDPQYDRAVDLMNSQQIKVVAKPQKESNQDQIHGNATPGETPMDPKEKIVGNAKQAILHCNQIKDKIGEICSQTGSSQYHMHMFDDMENDSVGLNSQMDDIVNNLIEVDEEDLATEIMDQMEYLQVLIQDIGQLNSKQNYYQQFRKKYIGNHPDLASIEESKLLQQQQQQQLQQQQALERQQAFERKQAMEKQQEIERKAALDKQKQLAEQQEKDRIYQEQQRQRELQIQQEQERYQKQKEEEDLRKAKELEQYQQSGNFQENQQKSIMHDQSKSVIQDQYEQIVNGSVLKSQAQQPNYVSKKPVSHSSIGKKQPAAIQKHEGDKVDDIIQINHQPLVGKDQLDDLMRQVQNLQHENSDLKEQLQREKENSERLIQIISKLKENEQNAGQIDQSRSSENQQRKINEQLKYTNLKLESQLNQLQNEIMQMKQNHEISTKILVDGHQQQIQGMQQQQNQHLQEKQHLKQQLSSFQNDNSELKDIQQKHSIAQQKIQQLIDEVEKHKLEKVSLHQNHSNQIEAHKHQLNENENVMQTYQEQMNNYKAKLEKVNKEYNALIERHKQQNENTLQQVIEAKQESNNRQSIIDQLQLELNDKEEELKQLQITHKAIVAEKKQLLSNLEQTRTQMNEFIQLYQNSNKNAENKSASLYQTKLKQTLDEIEQLKENHKNELENHHQTKQQIIDQLLQEKDQLTQQFNQQQNKPIEVQFGNMQAEQQQLNQTNKSFQASVEQVVQGKCPILTFKHFPQNQQFRITKPEKKVVNLSQDCQNIIFPYWDPQEYYQSKPKKQRKGRVVQSTSVSYEIAHLDTTNRNLFKQRSLGHSGLIYLDNEVQFGLMFQIQNYQGKQYYTYGLYIHNLQQKQENFKIEFLETDQFSQFWAQPIQFNKALFEDEQSLIELSLELSKFPSQLLGLQISTNIGHPFQFYIPNNICQMIIYKELKHTEFNNKWKQNIQNLMRTDVLLLNVEVFEGVQQLQTMIPRLIILNHHKTQDYEMGIDELKLGGYGSMSDIQFWIKFEILPDDQICIYLTYDQKYSKSKALFEQIIQGYAFIFGNGKGI